MGDSELNLVFDPRKSVAILVGTNHRSGEGGHDELYPAARNNVLDVAELVRNPKIIGISDVHLLMDLPSDEVRKKVRKACEGAEKPLSGLIFYYAGHGILDVNKKLYLSTPDTDLNHRHDSSILYDDMRRIIQEFRPFYPVVILDCCHSAAAVDAGGFAAAASFAGAFLLTACAKDMETFRPTNAPNTGFTGVLLSVLRHGISPEALAAAKQDDEELKRLAKPVISVADLFRVVKHRCNTANPPLADPHGNIDMQMQNETAAIAHNIGASETVTDKVVDLLEQRGLGLKLAEELRLANEAERIQLMDERVYECVLAQKQKAHLDPVVRVILEDELFREYHRSDWTSYEVRDQQVEIRIPKDDATGDADIRMTMTVNAAERIRSVWRFALGDAEIPNFKILRPQFESTPPSDWVILPLVQLPKWKEFVAYLNPPLPAGDGRTHSFSWHWPRAFPSLVKGKYEDMFVFRIRSAAPDIPMATTRFVIPASMGELEVRHEFGPEDDPPTKLEKTPLPDGFVAYEWRRKNVPANARIGLLLMLKRLPRS